MLALGPTTEFSGRAWKRPTSDRSLLVVVRNVLGLEDGTDVVKRLFGGRLDTLRRFHAINLFLGLGMQGTGRHGLVEHLFDVDLADVLERPEMLV